MFKRSSSDLCENFHYLLYVLSKYAQKCRFYFFKILFNSSLFFCLLIHHHFVMALSQNLWLWQILFKLFVLVEWSHHCRKWCRPRARTKIPHTFRWMNETQNNYHLGGCLRSFNLLVHKQKLSTKYLFNFFLVRFGNAIHHNSGCKYPEISAVAAAAAAAVARHR